MGTGTSWKFAAQSQAADEECKRKFWERELFGSLHHSHILRVLGICEEARPDGDLIVFERAKMTLTAL